MDKVYVVMAWDREGVEILGVYDELQLAIEAKREADEIEEYKDWYITITPVRLNRPIKDKES